MQKCVISSKNSDIEELVKEVFKVFILTIIKSVSVTGAVAVSDKRSRRTTIMSASS